MRIVVVSAHYPPNFVSGGTLQAQRVAQGLRRRGHDVQVYAGWLGEEHPPLHTWSELDGTGLPVRWVVTTPWTAWDDDRNWDNPEVAADFAGYLGEVRPDIVHLHSLQSLGAGLAVEAARAGSRVVVTMHDFWWCCARQFLVDRDMRPCCLVVDAGVCPCQRDRPWLEGRTHALWSVLDSVDLVLAPSASAARVLAANGIAAGKLSVDENGLPDGEDRARAARQSGRHRVAAVASEQPVAATGSEPLSLLYVGGSNTQKGVHVLMEAARSLAGKEGWRLVAHDAEPYVRSAGVPVDGLPVALVPPFDPESVDAVYAGADVLVIPSVMRESFSIAAREALTRGVPVICTDTLGPEEVVEHERNGLVVPAADPAALAAAVRRLLDEPELLRRLRAGCGEVSVRSMDDQVAGLEARFTELLEGAGPAAAPRSPRSDGPLRPGAGIGRVLFVCGIEGAPLRYRARLPAEALGLLGVATDVVHYRDPELGGLAARADAVVFYRVPATTLVLDLIAAIRDRGTPTFFDVDDLIFDPDVAAEIPALSLLPPDEAVLWLEGVRRYRTTMEACDVFIGSTEPLRRAAALTGMPTERFDNGVGVLLGRLADHAGTLPRRAGPVRLGYLSGTITHDLDWFSVEPAIAGALDRHPDTELWLVGHVPESAVLDRFASRVRRYPMLSWDRLPGVLHDIDVNLAPLVAESRFNQAKSAIKWLEAALVGTPTVASPTEPFREVVRDGHNGFLAASLEEWAAALDRLVADENLRSLVGGRARRDALLQFSPHLQGPRYLEILARGAQRSSTSANWMPVANDEPPLRTALEPYRTALEPSGRETPGLLSRGWACWRTEGTTRTARRVARRVASRRPD